MAGCPYCKQPAGFIPVCDEPGCWDVVCAGFKSGAGPYRNTCHKHYAALAAKACGRPVKSIPELHSWQCGPVIEALKDRLRWAHLKEAAAAASDAAQMAQQRYASGLIDFQIVLQAQRTLLAAQDSLSSASADLGTDVVRLYKALGGGWQ